MVDNIKTARRIAVRWLDKLKLQEKFLYTNAIKALKMTRLNSAARKIETHLQEENSKLLGIKISPGICFLLVMPLIGSGKIKKETSIND